MGQRLCPLFIGNTERTILTAQEAREALETGIKAHKQQFELAVGEKTRSSNELKKIGQRVAQQGTNSLSDNDKVLLQSNIALYRDQSKLINDLTHKITLLELQRSKVSTLASDAKIAQTGQEVARILNRLNINPGNAQEQIDKWNDSMDSVHAINIATKEAMSEFNTDTTNYENNAIIDADTINTFLTQCASGMDVDHAINATNNVTILPPRRQSMPATTQNPTLDVDLTQIHLPPSSFESKHPSVETPLLQQLPSPPPRTLFTHHRGDGGGNDDDDNGGGADSQLVLAEEYDTS